MTYGFENDKKKTEVYSKADVYNKDEVYNKTETYAKTEVYNKTETYNKTEVYNQNEIDEQVEDISESIESLSTSSDQTNRQVNNTYVGRNIATVYPDEIQQAGSPWAFLHNMISSNNPEDLAKINIGDMFTVPLSNVTISNQTWNPVQDSLDFIIVDINAVCGILSPHIVCACKEEIDLTGGPFLENSSLWGYILPFGRKYTSAIAEDYYRIKYTEGPLYEFFNSWFLQSIPSTLKNIIVKRYGSQYSIDFKEVAGSGGGGGGLVIQSSGNTNAIVRQFDCEVGDLGKIWAASDIEVVGQRITKDKNSGFYAEVTESSDSYIDISPMYTESQFEFYKKYYNLQQFNSDYLELRSMYYFSFNLVNKLSNDFIYLDGDYVLWGCHPWPHFVIA